VSFQYFGIITNQMVRVRSLNRDAGNVSSPPFRDVSFTHLHPCQWVVEVTAAGA